MTKTEDGQLVPVIFVKGREGMYKAGGVEGGRNLPLNDHSGFDGEGYNKDTMYRINTLLEEHEKVYDPDNWIWKWNCSRRPDDETPTYRPYSPSSTAIIEEAFKKYRPENGSYPTKDNPCNEQYMLC